MCMSYKRRMSYKRHPYAIFNIEVSINFSKEQFPSPRKPTKIILAEITFFVNCAITMGLAQGSFVRTLSLGFLLKIRVDKIGTTENNRVVIYRFPVFNRNKTLPLSGKSN